MTTAQTYSLAAYIVVTLTGRFISQRQRKAKRSLLSQGRAVAKDPTALLTALSAAVAIAIPIIEATLRETTISNVYTILAGLAVVLLGWGVAYVANRAISESWSPTIDKTKEQNLVASGVYSVVRHPLYLSGILVLTGTNIYFESSWAWLGALPALIALLVRVPIEERRLVERFGQEYIAYKKRTRAILPWIL
jgi:protein-S-isoprenylcysteine O-methyltransferase Ste14